MKPVVAGVLTGAACHVATRHLGMSPESVNASTVGGAFGASATATRSVFRDRTWG